MRKIVDAIIVLGTELLGAFLVLLGLWLIWKPLAIIAAGVLLVLIGGAIYAETQRAEQEDDGNSAYLRKWLRLCIHQRDRHDNTRHT